MKIITSLQEMQQTAERLREDGKKIGVVPTMGYLHEGHLSLVRIAKQQADVAIMTIFVNPAQFGPNEDFSRYPRDVVRDERLAEACGTDIIFLPGQHEMYPAHYYTSVAVEKLTGVLEGKSRPGHFQGVTTVVAKLFNITKPHSAVFGQKDAQQVVVIQQMIKDLNFDVHIVIGPIIREPDGLAMSSRNTFLSPEERAQSRVLYRSLQQARELLAKGERRSAVIISEMMKLIIEQRLARVDYISITHPATLEEISLLNACDAVLISLAVFIGSTRLIDNIIVDIRHPAGQNDQHGETSIGVFGKKKLER